MPASPVISGSAASRRWRPSADISLQVRFLLPGAVCSILAGPSLSRVMQVYSRSPAESAPSYSDQEALLTLSLFTFPSTLTLS